MIDSIHLQPSSYTCHVLTSENKGMLRYTRDAKPIGSLSLKEQSGKNESITLVKGSVYTFR